MTNPISKKDQIKTAIMDFLNKKGHSVARPEINKEVEKLGSTRTITRALAELKTNGLAIQNKDESTKVYSWVSTEPKTVETKTEKEKAGATDLPKDNKDKASTPDKDKKNADTKDSAGSSDKKESTKKSAKKTEKGKGPAKTKKTLKKDDIVKAAKDSKKAGQKKDAKAPGTPKRNPPASTPKKGPKKAGVIATIIKLISKKARTKKQILKGLVKAFPEREAAKMMKTINVQVPSRLRKDKDLNITKGKKGYKIESK